MSGLELGKDYDTGGQDTSIPFSNTPWADADNVSNFDLALNDILKVTWTMTIG